VAADELVVRAEAALARYELEAGRSFAAGAIELLRRPFLPGEDALWVVSKRLALDALLARALGCLAEVDIETGRSVEAVQLLEEAVALEPFRESGYRALMRAHVTASNPAEALRVYERCRCFLADELGAYPSKDTESFYRELLHARPAAVDVADGEARGLLSRPAPRAADIDVAVASHPREGRSTRRLLVLAAAAALALVVAAAAFVFVRARTTAAVTHMQANSAGELDAVTGRIVAQVRVGSGPDPIATGGGSVWVANVFDNTVSQVDPASSSVRQTIGVGLEPTAVAFGEGSLWVVCGGARRLLWIDPGTHRIVKRIPIGNGASAVALTPGREWVTNELDDTITEISAAGRVLRTSAAGATPSAIASGSGALWIANESASTVTRLDPQRRTLETIDVGNGPSAVAVGDRSVWVANALDGTVSRIDPHRNTVIATIPVGRGPSSVLVAGGNVWVANSDADTISRIDPGTNTVVATIGVANAPQGLAAAGSHVWLSARAGSLVHRGGTLQVVAPSGEITNIDPALGYAPAEWTVLAVLGDGLVGFERVSGLDGGTLEPDLATSLPAPTDGGLTYTFRLRPGIRYSDGERVRASDLRRALERDFRLDSPGAGYYAGLIGGNGCSRSRCDLSKGVVVDDLAGVVTLHLARPDPEFLYKLALPFADLVPAGTMKPSGSGSVPGTGPYMVGQRTADRLVLVRNPRFREWSAAAQPAGYPNRIVFSFAGTPGEQTSAVERGRSDLMQEPPASRYEELATRHAGELHVFPLAATFGLFLNTRVAPFDKLAVRRALNYAIDRRKVPTAFGGAGQAVSTCQILPLDTPGYRPRCLFTKHPGNAWTAPDLGLARRLIARSGTRGAQVTVYAPFPARSGQLELAKLGVATLDRLGFHAKLRLVAHKIYFPTVMDPRTRAQAGFVGWFMDYPAASDMLSLFTCREAATGNGSASQLCDRGLDREISGALAAQVTNPSKAPTAWSNIDTRATALAPWVPLATPRAVVLVSRRVGNLQYHTEFGPLVDQVWVN
jgi:YVTN family beta-propeller protein